MGYRKIENLRNAQEILLFKECFALEKIHGTSAHISFKRLPDNSVNVGYFSGGEKYDNFVKLFNTEALADIFRNQLMTARALKVYGEAYGGRQQGMSATYGKELKFVAFDLQITNQLDAEYWLNVPRAAEVTATLGLEFVAYERVSTDLAALAAERDRPSRQAVRNGILEPRPAEGVVLRPLEECYMHGDRVMAKFKRADFSERASKSDTNIDPDRAAALTAAADIAREWVVPVRLQHVLDALRAELQRELSIADSGAVAARMVDDVMTESHGVVANTQENRKAIGRAAVQLFHAWKP